MLKFIQNNREATAPVSRAAAVRAARMLDSQYLSVQTLTLIFSSSQILMLLAMGSTLVMLTRNIDVSVWIDHRDVRRAVGTAVKRWISLACGLQSRRCCWDCWRGLSTACWLPWLKIPAIVATLGTLGLYRGVMLLWTGGKWIEGLPAQLKQLSAPVFPRYLRHWLADPAADVADGSGCWQKPLLVAVFMPLGDNLQGARQLGVRTESHSDSGLSLNGCMAALYWDRLCLTDWLYPESDGEPGWK